MRRIPQQLIPLVVLFAVGITALFVARKMLVPKTFGEYGHYRAQAVDDIQAQDVMYAGSKACADCHDEIYELKQKSNHRGVACEVCHGPATQHIQEPEKFSPDAPRGRGYCPLCHGFNLSRPSGFPQIIEKFHNPGRPCMSCHKPHSPELPHAPEDCSACHRQIANEKTVSHHATLACITCHTTPAEHLVDPVRIPALKPASKAVCGGCHARDAQSSPEIPRIDLETHGERYLCWDCHYPHSPEAQ